MAEVFYMSSLSLANPWLGEYRLATKMNIDTVERLKENKWWSNIYVDYILRNVCVVIQ